MQSFLNKNRVASHQVTPHQVTSQGHPRQTGQGMTEYIIIVALIAIGAVTASSFFGARVQAQFVAMGAELSGEAGNVTGGVQAPTAAAVNLGTYNN